jgi:hypothetical protein
MDGYLFMDYDETPSADEETMRWVERQIEPSASLSPVTTPTPTPTEYGMAVGPETGIRLASGEILPAERVAIGDKLVTGATVVGVIRKEVESWVTLEDGTEVTPSSLLWSAREGRWRRVYEMTSTSVTPVSLVAPVTPVTPVIRRIFCSWVVVPNSQVELASGLRLRDYLEYCSPDTEHVYTGHLQGHAVAVADAEEEPVAK